MITVSNIALSDGIEKQRLQEEVGFKNGKGSTLSIDPHLKASLGIKNYQVKF